MLQTHERTERGGYLGSMTPLNALVEEACTQLRRREIEGSFAAAKRTAELMRLLITTQRHADAASRHKSGVMTM